MITRREVVKAGAGLAAIIAAGKAPAALVRSMLGMRNTLTGRKTSGGYWGLCFTAEATGSTVTLNQVGTPPTVALQTSADGKTWTDYVVGSMITLASVGDRVYFAAGPGGNVRLSSDSNSRYTFSMSGRIAASGSIMSLLDRIDPPDSVPGSCYSGMFRDCTSLTSAPALPATTLASYCYSGMFSGCTTLTSAPALPATTLASYCYDGMFRDCPTLTSAPELHATALVRFCYREMFYGCTSLTYIKVHFTTGWGGYTTSWVTGVSSSGVFRCSSALSHTASDFGASKIPAGWEVDVF